MKHQEVLKQLFKVLDSYMPQVQEYYDMLTEVMIPKYNPDDKVLYEEGQVAENAYFLASGFAISYYYNSDYERQVIRIYEKDAIIGGKSFTTQKPSEEYFMVCKDSYVLSITYDQVKEIYEKFPDTQEQERRIVAARELKELEHKKMLSKRGILRVLEFFQRYPELLEENGVLLDTDMASYLLMTDRSLRSLRGRLLREGKLKRKKG